MQSRIDDISKIIKEQIRHYESKTEQDEIGYVISVGDGISKVHGLDKCKANELLEFSNGSYGMALNLEETFVSCVLLGNDVGIKEGSIVKRTGRVVSVPVGEKLVGRVVNALGQPIDGQGPIDITHFQYNKRGWIQACTPYKCQRIFLILTVGRRKRKIGIRLQRS